MAAIVPLPSWYFDGTYNAYQEGFSRRFWAIRAFLRDEEYEDPKGKRTSLKECLSEKDFLIFPVPDYYGNKTFGDVEVNRNTSKLRNSFTLNMSLFYLPLVFGAVLLALGFDYLNLETR